MRSMMVARSNSGKTPSICTIIRPAGLVVSNGSVAERKPTPASSRSARIWASARTEAASASCKPLSPCAHPLSPEDEAWLARVQAEIDPADFLVHIGDGESESDYIVASDASGRWCAGRYIGHLSLD